MACDHVLNCVCWDRNLKCRRCARSKDITREFCPGCGETYAPNDGSDPEHRWPY